MPPQLRGFGSFPSLIRIVSFTPRTLPKVVPPEPHVLSPAAPAIRPRRKDGPERRFRCDLCPFAAFKASHLTEHMRGHTGERPFKCNQCSYAAKTNSYLTEHRKTHYTEKPFHCDQCPFATVKKCHLVEHKRTHNKERVSRFGFLVPSPRRHFFLGGFFSRWFFFPLLWICKRSQGYSLRLLHLEALPPCIWHPLTPTPSSKLDLTPPLLALQMRSMHLRSCPPDAPHYSRQNPSGENSPQMCPLQRASHVAKQTVSSHANAQP